MKKFLLRSFLLLAILISCRGLLFAGSGIYDFGIRLQGTNYTLNNTSGWGSNIFPGFSLGNVTSLTLDEARAYTWKDASGNVCSVTLNYRITKQGTTPGGFTSLAIGFNSDLGGGNQLWLTSPGTNLLTGKELGATYNFEVYYTYTGSTSSSSDCSGNYTLDNGGSYYIATFTYGNIYYSKNTGDVNTNANWNSKRDGSGSSAGAPSANNVYIIQSGHNMTTTATWGVANTKIWIESGGKLTTTNLITTTYFQVDNGGTYIHNLVSAASNGNTTDFPGTSWTFGATSTVEIQKWGNGGATPNPLPVIASPGWGHLIINVSNLGGSWRQNLATTTTLRVQGNFTISSLTTATNYFYLTNVAGSVNLDVGGTLTLSTGRLSASSTGTTTSVINIGGDLIISGGTMDIASSSDNNSYAINVNGTYASTTGKIAISSGQLYSITSSRKAFYTITTKGNFEISGTGIFQASGNSSAPLSTGYVLNIGGSFNMTGGTFAHSGTAANSELKINFTGGSSSSVSFTQSAGTFSTTAPVIWTVKSPKVLLLNNDLLTYKASSATGGVVVESGATLDCTTNNVTATSNSTFDLQSGGTLRIGNSLGIQSLGTNTGSIQTRGTRGFSTGANYEYTSTLSNQVTGPALPATVNNLTINNTFSGGIVQFNNTAGTQVNGALYLTAGTLDINAKTITMGNTTANSIVVTGARIITNSSATEGLIDVPTTSSNLTVTSSSGTSLSIGTKVEFRIAKGANFGSNFTTINDTLRIKSGGYVPTSGFPPYYSSTSTLIYDCGCSYASINSATNEWYENTFGTNPGVPNDVMIKAGTSLNFVNTSTPHEMRGNLTIGEIAGSASTFTLSTNAGGDFKIGGNWTHNQQGAFTHNDRTVEFNGATGNQVVTMTGSGLETFAYITFNKSGGGNVLLAGAPNATNIASAKNSGNVLKFLYGGLDLNGNTCMLTGSGGNINVVNGSRTITGAANSTLSISGNVGTISKTVTSSSSGALVTDVNVKILLATGIDFGSSLTTINGTLQMNPNAYVNPSTASAPYYGTSSTLIYNTGTDFSSINSNTKEWYENTFGTAAGVPNNVTIKAGSSLNFGTTAYPHEMQGSLTIGEAAGSNSTLTLSTVSGGDLNVGGSWTHNAKGLFIHNDREVTFNGSNDATLAVNTTDSTESFSYIVLNKSAKAKKLTLAGNVSVSNRAKFTRGTLDLSTRFFSILSTATKTAQIGQSDATNTAFTYGSGNTGQFIVQRYVPAKRAWRLMSPPVSGSNATISQAWQEGQAFDYASTGTQVSDTVSTGFATQITGGATTSGFDLSRTNSSSIKYYAGGAWSNPANTNATSVKSQEGWMLFVRGDRKNFGQITTQYKTPTITTLRPRGQIFVGQKRIPSSGLLTGKQVVGNPFASALDFHSAYLATQADNGGSLPYADKYYMWDPNLGGALGVGAFVTYTWNSGSGTYDRTSSYSPISLDDRYIPSGAAVIVDFGATGGYLLIDETDKNAATTTKAYRPSSNIRTNLLSLEPDSSTFISDGVLNLFDDSYNTAVDKEDATKFLNIEGENFSTKRGDTLLSIEKRKLLQANDTIFYNWSKVKVRSYQLSITTDSMENSWMDLYLEDNYKQTKTPVSYSDTTKYNFKIVVTDSGTFRANRFRLLMNYNPPTFNTINAFQQYSDVKVLWVMENERSISNFIVEKSTDGINFLEAGKVEPKAITGSNEYNWLDNDPLVGANYYRIKSVGNNGHAIYSAIAQVMIRKPQLSVYPNPVTDGSVGVQLTNMPKGNYSVSLINALGQTMVQKIIQHPGGDGTMKFPLANIKIRGTYQVQIIQPNKTKAYFKIIY